MSEEPNLSDGLSARLSAAGELRPMDHSAQNRCFGCGAANEHGLHLKFLLAEDGSVVSLSTISNDYEGPRGYLHGGIIATLLDEAMSRPKAC